MAAVEGGARLRPAPAHPQGPNIRSQNQTFRRCSLLPVSELPGSGSLSPGSARPQGWSSCRLKATFSHSQQRSLVDVGLPGSAGGLSAAACREQRDRGARRDGNLALALARAERASAVPGLGRGRRGGVQVAGAGGPGRGRRGEPRRRGRPPASSAPALRPLRPPGPPGLLRPHAAPPGADVNHQAAPFGPHPRRRPPAGPGHPPPAEGGRTEGLWKMRERGGAHGARLPLGRGR